MASSNHPELGSCACQAAVARFLDNGVLVDGTVQINASGEGRVQLGAETPPFAPPLRAEVKAFGNLVAATRGESVLVEVLGSGDATQAFQSFTRQEAAYLLQ
jgi:hypothetical protein